MPIRWISMVLLVFALGVSGGPAWSAIVPDGSVVERETDAPKLPPGPDGKNKVPKVKVGDGQKAPAKSSPKETTANRKPPLKRPNTAAPGNQGSAFGNQNAVPDPGDARPLMPLAPTPVSTGSTTPLWAALVMFLLLAAGGFWLAQQRSHE